MANVSTGKDQVAEFLAKRHPDFLELGAGASLRFCQNKVDPNDPRRRTIGAIQAKGKLVSDDTTEFALTETFQSHGKVPAFLGLNGYPRRGPQAYRVKPLLETWGLEDAHVICFEFEVSFLDTVKRFRHRRRKVKRNDATWWSFVKRYFSHRFYHRRRIIRALKAEGVEHVIIPVADQGEKWGTDLAADTVCGIVPTTANA